MNLKHLLALILLFLFAFGTVHAGGEPVNEDLSLLLTVSENLIEMAKERDENGFIELADLALQLTAENRNNSLILPRASAKFRIAKYAIKAGKFSESIDAIEQAKTILSRKKVLKWDGGS